MKAATMERRNFNRVIFSTQAELSANGKQWPTDVLELSLKGALLSTPVDFDYAKDDVFSLSFSLPGSNKTISMEGEIRHADDIELGFQCNLLDIDSVTELRRLIELNLSDETLLQRDLAALVKKQATS